MERVNDKENKKDQELPRSLTSVNLKLDYLLINRFR